MKLNRETTYRSDVMTLYRCIDELTMIDFFCFFCLFGGPKIESKGKIIVALLRSTLRIQVKKSAKC